MDSAYGLLGSNSSIFRSKYIGHNTYTGRISNFRSKPSPIPGPVHKFDLIFTMLEKSL